MSATKGKRAKAQATPVPQTREEAAQLLRAYGQAANFLTAADAQLKEDSAALKAAFEAASAPHKAVLKTAFAALQAFGEARRQELLAGARGKAADLGTGEIGWRTDPPSVAIAGEKALLERLTHAVSAELAALTRKLPFVRVKIEIDRHAVLRDPDAVKDWPEIAIIVGREQFYVAPTGLELAEA